MPTAHYGTGLYGVDTYGGGPESTWEEVYGPDYPLTAGDVPILENGVCRVQYEIAAAAFSLHLHDGEDYVEAGRFSFWHNSDDQYTLLHPFVKEWTPERAVVGGAFRPPDSTARCEVYLTLQRGWAGPRVEIYAAGIDPPDAAKEDVALRLAPALLGLSTLGRSSGTSTLTNGTSYGDFSTLEPWAYVLGPDPNLALHLAVLQEGAAIDGRDDSAMYGAVRHGLSLASPAGDGYLSATLGVGPRATAAADAETLGRTNLIDARAVPMLVER